MILLNYFYLISNKKIKSIELSKYILKKIENSFNYNFFINFNYKYIIKQSLYSDIVIKKKLNSILTGIPVIYKDILKTKFLNTTAGSRILKNYKSPYNATIINRLKNKYAVNFGKSNMDEFGVGSWNKNFYYGLPKNNFNKNLSCGGSSGGSTYLVSKNLIPVALSSDTGGSTRQPAYLCGLIGFKSTYGRLSRYGMISYSSSMDTIGFICKDIISLSIFLNCICGFDVKDSTSINLNYEDYSRYINKNWLLNKINSKKSLEGLKIGISKIFFNNYIDFLIRSDFEYVLNIFEILGAKIIFLYIFFFNFIQTLYYIISSSEIYSNLSRYKNFLYKFNYFNKNKNYINKDFDFNSKLKLKILLGSYLLFNDKNKKYFFFSKKIRRFITENFKKIFSICDIILSPILPSVSLKNNLKNNFNIFEELYMSISNITGLPSAVVSIINKKKSFLKKPKGFQIISNYFKEARIIQIINEFKKATNDN
ncbi:aspartyl/glutamyl-tRNA(Asn/Gln) amidotransferasesubunit A [Candidatus Nasuia deltocephalinicola]|uniref:Aspartyl/glutamyl-tRNA(Asn/Gln) amidotransferasesubunit A n=1 Tax=Candidatus Nasuia deltocephalincola TaxID=1160784 RepID=A0A0S2UP25_9PROT|nr:aspartyl/glutamyl-tRNA(Asn/Gln) amidotransferasesubunit A [Candidatus Nasuia deltocephalinicola]